MIFLHGGNDDPNLRKETFGRFVQAASMGKACQITLVTVEATEPQAQESFADYRAIFDNLSNLEVIPVLLTPEKPLRRADLEKIAPTGVFICGGVTPLYHQALCIDRSWISYLKEANVPYCGTSAGAAIAASQAVLGGWQVQRDGATREILYRGAGEGLDLLTVQEGLGLVPFAIDVHASQMGTLTRLIHAVELGLVSEGWAIDENTMLIVEEGQLSLYGRGHAYRVSRDGKVGIRVEIKTAL